MFRFGFSYVGLIYLLMLFIPNIIWTKNQPADYEQYVKKENRILQLLEKIGEVSVCCVVLIFRDFNIRPLSLWSLWLVASFVLMLFYEYYWICYFKSKKRMCDFYRSVCGVPVAGATLPVCAFFLLGIYGCNAFLMVATIILGIGHIGIHYQHYREIVVGRKGKKKLIEIILGVVLGIIVSVGILIALALTVIIGFRNFNYIKCFISSDTGIYEGIYVPLSGQEQYLHISGENTENPVMIYLHGGPASPDSLATYTFTRYLSDEYTVICWDQRGCGRTYYKNCKEDPDNKTVTFEQAQKDLDALVDYACDRFGKEKVVIMGHSYGTLLGSEYVQNHPEKVSAYIGIGQFVSTAGGERVSYENALAATKAKGNDTTKMTAAYEAYQKEANLDHMMALRKQTAPYHKAPRAKNTIWIGLTSPNANLTDFRWQLKPMLHMDEYIALNKELLDYTFSVELLHQKSDYRVPVTFITGSCDFTTPVACTEEYMNGITAPAKKLCVMEGCSHSPQFDAPQEFGKIVKEALNKEEIEW
ncbi:MAG: alpha/beta hydrolase [Lachnospiraceae bacterium]|nr:alpha/beta hydrolase [Lachnospiraceae bacterium]